MEQSPSNAFEKFQTEFRKIEATKVNTQISFVMKYLQDLGNAKEFEAFQNILDNADPKDFKDAVFTIALAGWWYGNNLNRDKYIEKAIKHYDELMGAGYGLKLFGRIRTGAWTPTFGFERELFGQKE